MFVKPANFLKTLLTLKPQSARSGVLCSRPLRISKDRVTVSPSTLSTSLGQPEPSTDLLPNPCRLPPYSTTWGSREQHRSAGANGNHTHAQQWGGEGGVHGARPFLDQKSNPDFFVYFFLIKINCGINSCVRFRRRARAPLATRASCFASVDLDLFFQIYLGKTASAAINLTNSAIQTDATTFAFSSNSILLLCLLGT